MSKILIEPQLLPPIEFFTRLMVANEVIFDLHQHFEKQTYRNRCYILGANKVERLTIPVVTGNRTPLKDVKISYDEDWVKTFWRTISSAYANAPFYLFYAEEFQQIFFSKPVWLVELNERLLTICLKYLNIDVRISYTENYVSEPPVDISDLRSVISPKQRHSSRSFYTPVAYPQLFGLNFDANLSIIDLIFCEGPNSQAIVTKSIK